MNEYIEKSLKKLIEEVEDRLWSKRGGAAHDYANFCVSEDFDWLREEITSDFYHIPENLVSEIASEFDTWEEAEDEVYSMEVETIIDQAKYRLLEQIEEVEYSVGTHKIYEHIVNEVENRFNDKGSLKQLADMLIEKEVVDSLEELEEIESYQQAKAYLDNKFPENKNTKVSNVEQTIDKLNDIREENFLEMASEVIKDQKQDQFEKIKEIKKKKSDKERFQEIGMTIDQYVLSLIRKPNSGLKQELKKLQKKGFITKDQSKQYVQYQKEYKSRMSRDFPDFNKVEEENILLDKLQNLKEKFLHNEDFSLMSFNAGLTFSKNPIETFEKMAANIFSLADKTQKKILELGSKDNPLIFMYFENIAIIAEQIFINLSYEFDKLLFAIENKNLMATTISFDLDKKEDYDTVIEEYKMTFAHFFYENVSSPEKCHKRFSDKQDIMNYFESVSERLLSVALEELKQIEESNVTNPRYIKNERTLQNIQESFRNQYMYDMACLHDKEIEERAKNYSYEKGEGKEAFLMLYKQLQSKELQSVENLAIELHVSEEEVKNLLKIHSNELI